MGRRLSDKLPIVTIRSERITEAHWQQLLCQRDARGELRQKEYAECRQQASAQRDSILLDKSSDNLLSPNFEPVPLKAVEMKGNSVLIQDQEGNTKLRNASHMKKFIQPGPSTEACTEAHEGDEVEDSWRQLL